MGNIIVEIVLIVKVLSNNERHCIKYNINNNKTMLEQENQLRHNRNLFKISN